MEGIIDGSSLGLVDGDLVGLLEGIMEGSILGSPEGLDDGFHKFAADVGIRGRKIAAIGDLKDTKARVRINAQGLAVAPGFIDSLPPLCQTAAKRYLQAYEQKSQAAPLS